MNGPRPVIRRVTYWAALCVLLVSAGAIAQPKAASAPAGQAPVTAQKVLANPTEISVLRPGANPVVEGIPKDIRALIEAGEFTQAIDRLTSLKAPDAKRPKKLNMKTIDWQIEKLRRYMGDYNKSRDQIFARLKEKMRDFRPEEFDAWIQQGLVDRMQIDGQERFASATVSNLFFLSPELRKREISDSEGKLQKYVRDSVVRLSGKQKETKSNLLEPQRYRVTMTVTTKCPADRDGQTLRCWMPFPREFPFVKDIQLLESKPAEAKIAPADAPQRTVYLEQVAHADTPVTFTIVYEYTIHARVYPVEDGGTRTPGSNKAELKQWMGEEAHVQYTPEMRKLYRQIAGKEKDPSRLARLFYNWISANVRYSYAREYSTLDDIGLYCGARLAGDCGQEALLYITLCRMAGIPARWQSGWTTFPDWTGLHDWTEIYLEPHGWIPVDPYMGIWAEHYMDQLTPDERVLVRDFYFGSMDACRLPANAAHSAPFDPPKQGWRSDDVDSQRGELEWADGTNIYFDAFDYDLDVKPIEGKSGTRLRSPE